MAAQHNACKTPRSWTRRDWIGFNAGAAAALLVAKPAAAATFIKGADVSWVSQQESAGYSFYNASGVKTDPFRLLADLGVNVIRLRVWVNPSGGWCDGADTLYKAKRALAMGQKIMLTFHYSDTWADPGHQTKPSAWSSHKTISELATDVYSHTQGILNYLKTNGVTVDWVQVGNEINSGMLWPEGKASGSSFGNLVQLINSGYNAVKAVFPSAKVILHLANGHDNTTFRWFFDGMKTNGAKYDVIGMSHYPTASNWTSLNASLSTNMADMVSRYGKPVVVAETGMDWQQAAAAKSMITDLISRVSALGGNGLGVLYWEPEAYPGWQQYTLGALNGSGRFTAALDPF
ncbi:glycosyl hydrolase 53 family protein [Curvibacter sp. CHRR-16]|uniref:glycoside hydrolase family 53 protein n=1 Tax=Curvibacter sp. CHRR-16 TaxID=2835872 RepID=UPI001BDAE02B|nr:glycosyl hydrolase 53 family protein [Curvibacter sp. CHRR-16]MBT0571648.1 glycosyl hydrolase 53 family protein [Curvibacter sp. CHRR-16]